MVTHLLTFQLPLASNNLDTPPETRSIEIQTEPQVQWHGEDIEDYDGNCLMNVKRMEDFVRTATAHSAKCGKQLVLAQRDTSIGSYVQHTWKCPCCQEELSMENCEKVRSKEVAVGAKYSKHQPDFNLRAVKGARLSGINVTKLQEFMEGHMGIKLPTDNNLRKQMTKVHESIRDTYKQRKEGNKREHVNAVRASEKYSGDLTWGADGDLHSTSCGDLSTDGAGGTRIYNHRHRGRTSAFVVNSMETGLPVELVVSMVSPCLDNVHIVQSIESHSCLLMFCSRLAASIVPVLSTGGSENTRIKLGSL